MTAPMHAMIAIIKVANTIEEIKEIVATLETALEFIANMQQLCDSILKEKVVLFYHRCLSLSHKITPLKAIKVDQLELFPGLTYELISRHLPQTTADMKSRTRQIRQGAQSIRVEDMNQTEEVSVVQYVYCYGNLADLNTAECT